MAWLSFGYFDRWRDAAAFVLRGCAGVVFAYHGYQKVQNGISGFEGFVDSLGIPLPGLVAPLVTFLELIGGIMLVAGLLTRLVALLFAIEMIGTTLLVKIDVGLIGQQGAGAEIDVMLWAACVALVLLGPGLLALDRVFGIDRAPLPAPERHAGAMAA